MYLIADSSNGSKNLQTRCESRLFRDIKHPTSNTDTLIHFLKANIGTGIYLIHFYTNSSNEIYNQRSFSGILAMPRAFKNSGLYFGLIGTLALGCICTHSMLLLLGCSRELCRRLQIPSMDFADVTYYAFKTGPYRWQKFSNLARCFN